MPSKAIAYKEAFVWIWLPSEVAPVVAGKLTAEGPNLIFNYGQSYLERENKIALYDEELPLKPGKIPLLNGLNMPSCIRDGSPDAWGRRVLINKKYGSKGTAITDVQLDELTYLLESGSDRIGALDFQLSPTQYEPRANANVSLAELIDAAAHVEKGTPLTPELEKALNHGTAIGGARPKALVDAKGKKYIAKFSSSTDIYSVIKAEFIAMRLGKLSGLDVASVELKKAAHKDVLLIERFDRHQSSLGWQRKGIISALTLFGLDEMMARYASYETLAEIVRRKFKDASLTLKELFGRMTFNILVGNTDDHARNHAAFWDGGQLKLTSAYDICPQSRTGNEASQAMLIHGNNNMSQLEVCLASAHNFLLSRTEAISIIEHQISSIIKNWEDVCKIAEIAAPDRRLFGSRQFLNPFAFEGLGEDACNFATLVQEFKTLVEKF